MFKRITGCVKIVKWYWIIISYADGNCTLLPQATNNNLKDKLFWSERGADKDDEDNVLHLVYRKESIVTLEFVTLIAKDADMAKVSNIRYCPGNLSYQTKYDQTIY